ncbi:MAG: hypothetical protein ACJ8CB_02895 [Ktedonobacteraceae bacterium]
MQSSTTHVPAVVTTGIHRPDTCSPLQGLHWMRGTETTQVSGTEASFGTF